MNRLLIVTSTFPKDKDDAVTARFVLDLACALRTYYSVIVLAPHCAGLKFFEEKKVNEKEFNLILEASTDRQEGDIAGSKLLKFSRLVLGKLERYFKIKKNDFNYEGKHSGKIYIKAERKKEIIYSGPPINKPERLLAFKQAHKKVFIKKNVSFAIEKSLSFKEVFAKFLKDNKTVMKERGITNLKVKKTMGHL